MADTPTFMYSSNFDLTEDQDFAPKERLFLRFKPDHYKTWGTISLAAIEMPDMSVNREKHGGEPEFVLAGHSKSGGKKIIYDNWGVASFNVKDIPGEQGFEGEIFSFRPFHQPTRKNFFHSEIRCYDSENIHIDSKELYPDHVKLRWRDRLRHEIQVVIRPGDFDGIFS